MNPNQNPNDKMNQDDKQPPKRKRAYPDEARGLGALTFFHNGERVTNRTIQGFLAAQLSAKEWPAEEWEIIRNAAARGICNDGCACEPHVWLECALSAWRGGAKTSRDWVVLWKRDGGACLNEAWNCALSVSKDQLGRPLKPKPATAAAPVRCPRPPESLDEHVLPSGAPLMLDSNTWRAVLLAMAAHPDDLQGFRGRREVGTVVWSEAAASVIRAAFEALAATPFVEWPPKFKVRPPTDDERAIEALLGDIQ